MVSFGQIAEVDLHSLGHACSLLQRTPRAISTAAEQLGIVARIRINNVPHYDADQLETLMGYFRTKGQS